MLIPNHAISRLKVKRHKYSLRGGCANCGYPDAMVIYQGRDGNARLFCANGCRPYDLYRAVQNAVGGTWTPPRARSTKESVATNRVTQALAHQLWDRAEPASGTLVEHYLTGRNLPSLASSLVLRFLDNCRHPEGSRFPAMVAQVADMAGAPVAIHRTYIGRTGRKANVKPTKASLGPVWGAAIRLDTIDPELPLVIGEGIESSASAGRLLGFPAWAALSAGNLARGVVLPPEVRKVIIAADPDPVGSAAARAAMARWIDEGRHVRIATTGHPDKDFNDVLMEARNG